MWIDLDTKTMGVASVKSLPYFFLPREWDLCIFMDATLDFLYKVLCHFNIYKSIAHSLTDSSLNPSHGGENIYEIVTETFYY